MERRELLKANFMRIQINKFLMIFTIGCLPATSIASDWYYFGRSTLGDMQYIDASSIVTLSNGTKRAWFSEVEVNGSYNKTLEAFKCTSKESNTIKYNGYDKDGRVLKSTDFNKSAFSPVVPDTIGETMLEVACSKTPKTLLNSIGEKASTSPQEHAKATRSNDVVWDDNSSTTETSSLITDALKPSPGLIAPSANCTDECAMGFYWAQRMDISSIEDCGAKSITPLLSGCFVWVHHIKNHAN